MVQPGSPGSVVQPGEANMPWLAHLSQLSLPCPFRAPDLRPASCGTPGLPLAVSLAQQDAAGQDTADAARLTHRASADEAAGRLPPRQHPDREPGLQDCQARRGWDQGQRFASWHSTQVSCAAVPPSCPPPERPRCMGPQIPMATELSDAHAKRDHSTCQPCKAAHQPASSQDMLYQRLRAGSWEDAAWVLCMAESALSQEVQQVGTRRRVP